MKTNRRRYRNTDCPTGKRKFSSWTHATSTMVSAGDRTANVRAYRCPKCSYWHLTSRF